MSKIVLVQRAFAALLPVSAILISAGCEDSTGPEEEIRFTLSVVVPSEDPLATANMSSPSPSSLLQTDGTHTLILDRVALVVREVELKRISDDDCDALTGDDHDACESVDLGPTLLELPLDGSVTQILASDVTPDVYDEIEFDVHKPEDDSIADLQFLQQHPDFRDVSIRVEGSFDGEGFVFLQDLNEERELELVPPLVVEEGFGSVNLTLELDVVSWFRADDRSLLDPRTANKGGQNEDLVEENIRASINAFEDSDGDGRRD